MTTDTQDRDSLSERLREVLGYEQAATLMHLLPADHDQLATKADTGALDARMDRLDRRMDRLEERMDSLERHMATFDQPLWDFHEALRAQTRVYITAMVSGMIGVGGLALAGNALIG